MQEERLRDEIDFLKRSKLELESALLDRDSKVLESRFDIEAAEVDIERLRRRVSELEQVNRALRNIATANGNERGHGTHGHSDLYDAGITGGQSGTKASKREQELEAVVETMRRVVDKLRNENDRLKRGIGVQGGQSSNNNPDDELFAAANAALGNKKEGAPTTPGTSEVSVKKLQAERKKVEKLTEEVNTWKEKVKGIEDLQQKLAGRQQQIASLRKQLKSKEDENNKQIEEMSKLIQERDTLKNKVKAFEESGGGTSGGNGPTSGSSHPPTSGPWSGPSGIAAVRDLDAVRKQLSAATAENDVLKQDVIELKRKLQTATTQAVMEVQGSTNLAGTQQLQSEVSRLKGENEKLKQELSAFDLDFFEEIENLKFAHAQAVRKIKMYEQQIQQLQDQLGGGGGGRGGRH